MSNWTRKEFEAWCKGQAKYYYLGDNRGLCIVLGKFKMFVPTHDCSLVPHLIEGGFWEAWISCAMLRLIPEGSVCIDIGANIGYYSILMALATSRTGHVVAIEANPDLYDMLLDTFKVNGLKIVTVSGAAWNASGDRLMFETPGNYLGGAVVRDDPDEVALPSSDTVETIAIDDLVQRLGLPSVDVVKIDVEGAEPKVIEGMTETIAKSDRMQIFMEYAPETEGIGPELYDQVRDLGFSVALIDVQGRSVPIGRDKLPEDGISMLHLRKGI